MQETIKALREELSAELAGIKNQNELETFRIKYLARKGRIAGLFDALKNVPAADKPPIGKALNELRSFAQTSFEEKEKQLQQSPIAGSRAIDVSLPGRPRPVGSKHPITQTIDELRQIFGRMGFSVASGPDIEDDYHNFTALNFPPDHPARDMQDTFFISKSILLRTHTSPVQIRVMENQQPPVRVIIPGRVYRNEAISSRSHVIFHQLEGLYVDTGVTFSELKGTLVSFAKQLYGSSVRYKFRPTFFPFTEPSADMYISCFICNQKGCPVCKYIGWLEILGSGMVHPNVLKYCGYDIERFSGYAFGMGIERMALLRYGIDDIRLYFENDLRFLRQF
ncbi:MAG: phenylalanine--tRNA ligase subunit alpha [Ignavibacteriales bacterium]|nr:phenylalanine--tRNA ligase subunit alpha [Ignavibacteriales bacterium]